MTTVLAFRPVVLSGRKYPLPASAQVSAKLRGTGEEVRNDIDFRDCHRYAGESRIIFGDSAAEDVVAPSQPEVRALAGGLTLELALDGAVEASSAAAGDSISASLVAAVKAGKSIIPAGARVRGRLVDFEFDFEARRVRAVLQFHRIESGGSSLEFRAQIRSAVKAPGVHWQFDRSLPTSGSLWLDGTARIPAGLRMKWQTVEMR